MEKDKHQENKISMQEFMDYVRDNFAVSGESQRLIENALRYAGTKEPEMQHDILCFLLDGTIGLTEEEIGMIAFN